MVKKCVLYKNIKGQNYLFLKDNIQYTQTALTTYNWQSSSRKYNVFLIPKLSGYTAQRTSLEKTKKDLIQEHFCIFSNIPTKNHRRLSKSE